MTVRNEETGVAQVATTDRQGRYSFIDIQPGNSALFVNAPGFQRFNLSNIYIGIGRTNQIDATLNLGSASETVEVQGQAQTIQTESSLIGTAEKQGSEAEGKSAGDFFNTRSIRKLPSEKINPHSCPSCRRTSRQKKSRCGTKIPLHFAPSGSRTPAGRCSTPGRSNILESRYLCRGRILETIHPDERRLLSYAGDAAVHVKYSEDSTEKPYSRVRIAKGVMQLTKEQRSVKKYAIRNADKDARIVVVEYPVEEDRELTPAAPKPEESSGVVSSLPGSGGCRQNRGADRRGSSHRKKRTMHSPISTMMKLPYWCNRSE